MPQQKLITIKLTSRELINRFNTDEMEVPFKYGEGLVSQGMAVFKGGNDANKKVMEEIIPPPIKNSPEVKPVESKQREIVWLQDAERIGGAELSNIQVVKIGRQLGFDICVMTPQTFNWQTLRHAGLIIINNIWHFDVNQMNAINRVIFEYLIPYAVYSHDIRDSDERIQFARRLFKHSKTNFFISPAHKQKVESKVYEMSPSHILPLAIDPDLFKPVKGVKRQKGLVVSTAGRLHNAKQPVGLLSFIKSHPELHYELYLEPTNLINQLFAPMPNVAMKLPVDHEELPRIYSHAEYMVHLSAIFGAGERVILEAALCGCKIISSKNSGHMSWNWDWEDTGFIRSELKKAPYEFWKVVEKLAC